MYYPPEEEFVELSKKGNLIPVYQEMAAGKETPVTAFKKIEGDYSFLLESVEGEEKIARFSFLGSVPKQDLCSFKSFAEIKSFLSGQEAVTVPGLPRFHGGLVGYVSYDMVRQIEDIPDKNPDELKLPPMLFLKASSLLAFDHVRKKLLVISNAEVKGDPKKAYQAACSKIDELYAGLKKPLKLEKQKESGQLKPLRYTSNMTQQEYEGAVEKAQEYIRAGDIIQVVPSQRLAAKCNIEPFDVYRVLRELNPSPYMFYLKFGRVKIAGSSPEVMVRLEGHQATVRPIAGTRRRGRDAEEDKKMAEELLASDKERAEHIMLVDLGRNDLGRVCDFGTVRVSEEMVIERYSHVMHIVSNVVGRLKKGRDAVDLLMATFPAGTVSGAPKVRAMEIIDELENVKRGPYAGCVGYFGFSGEMDTGITIRTIIFRGDKAYVQVGAGIVADSVPAEEYKETVSKARAMLKAIEMAS